MDILNALIENCRDAPAEDVVVGVFNTLVLGGRAGLASSLKPKKGIGGIEPGTLTGKTTLQLAQLSLSHHPIEASIGLAAINASIHHPNDLMEMDGRELYLTMGKNKICACIGHFPFLKELEHMLKKLYTFEREPMGNDLPEDKIPEVLPLADVVLITGMTLTNHTFEGLMHHVRRDAYVIVMGPTAPVSPILFDFGVDAVCGTIVMEPKRVLEQVKIGVSYKDLKGVKKVCITKECMNG